MLNGLSAMKMMSPKSKLSSTYQTEKQNYAKLFIKIDDKQEDTDILPFESNQEPTKKEASSIN